MRFIILFTLFVLGCNKEDVKKTSLPILNTKSATTITSNSSVVGGFISSDGGMAITERGICYSSLNENPSVTDNVITEGSGTGNYQCNLLDLDPETKYYARAYALNSVGIGYGNLVSFTTINEIMPPNAAFTATPTNGPEPLSVNFTDQSTNTPVSYQWNFGDGGTSTIKNPSHTYNTAGMYTVQLIVSNDNSSDTEIKNNYITVTSSSIAPVAAFTGNPTTGGMPMTVNFTDQSINCPISWQWSFGDGGTSLQQNPNHTYHSAGNYKVQLTVTNNYGSDIEVKNNYINVTSSGGSGTVTDIDGNVYQIVNINSQIWMVENLMVTHYNNGDVIPNIVEDSQWNNSSTGAYCWYNNDINWKNAYGALYNWYTTVDNRGLCPSGWHIPNDVEWTILANFLGGESGKLKSARTEPDDHPRWASPNTDATNQSGFSGLPGGYRQYDGIFFNFGTNGHFWSSTEFSSDYAWHRAMSYYYRNFSRFEYGTKRNGLSVRCLKD